MSLPTRASHTAAAVLGIGLAVAVVPSAAAATSSPSPTPTRATATTTSSATTTALRPTYAPRAATRTPHWNRTVTAAPLATTRALTIALTAPGTALATAPSATLRGTVTGAPAGTAVTVETVAGGRWVPSGSTTTGSDGRFAWVARLSPSLASSSYRARVATADATAVSQNLVLARVLPADDVRVTEAQGRGILASKGIPVYSSGSCSDRLDRRCTSLDTMRTMTLRAVVKVKDASGCAVTLTGGTETGHATGDISHWNGYKADLAMTSCLRTYVASHALRLTGPFWYDAPTTYYDEIGHFDLSVAP